MRSIHIEIAGTKLATTPGAKHGQDLINLGNVVAPEQLVLEVDGDVDIAIGPDDVIVVRGGERFSIGDGSPQLPDNPVMRKPIAATLAVSQPRSAASLFPRSEPPSRPCPDPTRSVVAIPSPAGLPA